MYTTTSYDSSYMLLSLLSSYMLVLVVLLILLIVAQWKIFEKAGKPGWASIIPFYSSYVEYDAFWGDTRYFWVALLCGLLTFVPFIGFFAGIAAVVLSIILTYKKAQSFGQSVGFTLGLIFLPNIFTMILAFGNFGYIGAPEKSDSEKKVEDKVEDFVQENIVKEPHEDEANEPVCKEENPHFRVTIDEDGTVSSIKHDVVDAEMFEEDKEEEGE